MPQHTSAFAPLCTAILNFEVPRRRKIMKSLAEIPGVAVAKMDISHLLNIRQGDVGDIDELTIYLFVGRTNTCYGENLQVVSSR